MDALVVTTIVKTCDAVPAQWEGRLADGRWIYVRYRGGHLSIGLGATIDAAVDDALRHSVGIGDALDGWLEYDALKELARGFTWPDTESESN